MNHPNVFTSVLGPTITEYVALKRALGRRYDGEQRVFAALDAFLATTGSDLTPDTFTRWCRTQEHLTSTVRRHRMRLVRHLALYRRRREPSCYVPDAVLFPVRHQPAQPYIFTHAEIARLLQQANALKSSRDCPLRSQLFSLAITLLYTAGLRRGELLRLTLGDYDQRQGTLRIRESKFHKSRLVPLSADAIEQLDRYIEARKQRRLPAAPQTALVWNKRGGGRAYSATGFYSTLRRLFQAAAIRKPDGRLPRIHDLRHGFAVHALQRWYSAGEDVQAKLPLLSIYMGHVSITSTQYYLKWTEPLANAASERFAKHCAHLVQPLQIPGGE